jgi:putative transposase
MSEFNSSSHSKYLVQYHIIWCPKFRFEVLNDDISESLKRILLDISNKYLYEIKALEVMPDHIHLFVSTKPTVAPTDIVRTLKSISAIELFKKYPKLKKFYGRSGSLWSSGYFVSSVGNVSENTIKKYIEEQNSK